MHKLVKKLNGIPKQSFELIFTMTEVKNNFIKMIQKIFKQTKIKYQ